MSRDFDNLILNLEPAFPGVRYPVEAAVLFGIAILAAVAAFLVRRVAARRHAGEAMPTQGDTGWSAVLMLDALLLLVTAIALLLL